MVYARVSNQVEELFGRLKAALKEIGRTCRCLDHARDW